MNKKWQRPQWHFFTMRARAGWDLLAETSTSALGGLTPGKSALASINRTRVLLGYHRQPLTEKVDTLPNVHGCINACIDCESPLTWICAYKCEPEHVCTMYRKPDCPCMSLWSAGFLSVSHSNGCCTAEGSEMNYTVVQKQLPHTATATAPLPWNRGDAARSPKSWRNGGDSQVKYAQAW